MMKQLRSKMVTTTPKETFVHEKVTYTLDVEGKLLIIEHVPARVCLETGEQFFSADTAERIQRLVLNKEKPTRVIEVPVIEFA
ncbi:MAG: YgiT-type zinc finger protein [Chloroflexi bacterium]|nr:YgiT-type zinc finger protein [Chloroflexota bacterium]